MKIASMTGFGKSEVYGAHYNVTVEVKSVNNRFKDIKFKIPTQLSFLEFDLKKKLEATFKRGSFELSVSFKKNDKNYKFDDVDLVKVENYVLKFKKLSEKLNIPLDIKVTEFLRAEFYTDNQKEVESELSDLVMKATDSSVEALKTSRWEEGAKLGQVLKKHIEEFKTYYAKVVSFENTLKQEIEKRLKDKLKELRSDIKFDENRFHQELIYYLEKLDIQEEINRINIHLGKLESLLVSGEEMGRNIDFILQELNRETNTIGSKCNNVNISQLRIKVA